MTLPASESQMPEFGDIHHATMGCISDFESCLSIKPLMKESWAESRLADLNLWASGVGALASPDASLDRRLQFQPKPRLVLINLLLTLREFISNCRMHVLNEIHDKKENIDNEAESETAPVSPAESTLELTLGDDSNPTGSSISWFTALAYSLKTASDTSTDSSVGDEVDDPHSEVTLKKVMKDIDDILDQLIMLGFAIRKSGTVARLRKADSSFKPNENEDLQKHLEFILLNSAAKRQKYSEENVENTTEKRIREVTPEQQHLVLANLRRRHRFRYARRHQQKLDQLTINPPVARSNSLVHTTEEHQEMTPGLKRSPVSDDGKSRPSNASPKNIQGPEMSATIPSVPEGNIMQIAIPMAAAASRVSVSVATMHYPSPPPISQQMRGFKCPCCYQTLPEMFQNWSRWRKHLMEDLCPYTCPFPKCPRPEVLYISRATWRDHVLQSHGAGQNWECLACVGTGMPITFLSAEEFVSHNRTKHIDTISEDQIIVLQNTSRKIVPPNIAQCPLCPWPQNEKETPDAVANLEHVGNCIHEFSLNALPWAESLVRDATDPSNPALRSKVEEWLKSTEEKESADIQKINIKTFVFFPTQPLPIKQEWEYIPEEYFAESSKESSEVERGSLSLDSDVPEVKGTYSDDMSNKTSKEISEQMTAEKFQTSTMEFINDTDSDYSFAEGDQILETVTQKAVELQGMAQNSTLNFPTQNAIFCADNFLYEELDPDFSASLGGFKMSNPDSNRFQRQMMHVSSAKSKFKKTVELVLCIHGWKSSDRKHPMTLIVLGVNLSCHDRSSRFQSVKIRLQFDEDDKRDPNDAFKAYPQVVAYAPFVQQERWNTTVTNVKDNNGYGGKLGVNQFGQAEVSANKSSEVSYIRKHFDRGSADRLYDERTGRLFGVEWFCEQNQREYYGVMPNFHLAVLLERSHDEDRAISFKAEFDMRTEAGFMHDFEQGLRRAFRRRRPEDDPVYFDPSKGKPDVYGVAGVGEQLLKSIDVDNLGALAEGKLLSKLIDSVGGSLPGLEPMEAL